MSEGVPILNGLFWFASIWLPPVIYAATFRETFEKGGMEPAQRIALAIAFGFALPAFVSASMPGFWMAFFNLLYAACTFVAHLFYKDELRKRMDRQRIQEQSTAASLALETEHREQEELQHNLTLIPSTTDFVAQFMTELNDRCLQAKLPTIPDAVTLYADIVAELYEHNIHRFKFSPPRNHQQRLRDVPTLLTRFKEPLFTTFLEFRRLIPFDRTAFKVPALDIVGRETSNRIYSAFTRDRPSAEFEAAYPTLYAQLKLNALGQPPEDAKGPVYEVVERYFRNTPLLRLFTGAIPVALPDQTRFQHQWLIAPTGSGKTQLLQSQIIADLEKVKDGNASVIIMDSQGMGEGKFLSNIARLKLFAKGHSLEDKLVVLQPDLDFPLALNLFDMGQHDALLSSRDRQILRMSALKMITFCLAGTTDQQQDMIEYLVQLAMEVPGASIATVRRMLSIKNAKEFETEFAAALATADETVREYFLHSYFGQGQGGIQATTRDAVLRRIMGMLRNPVFRKMYQNERNKFSMLKEIEAGKVIVINTDIELMGKEACELFGRFFISLLVQATQQRKSTKPVYCYIDECQDYVARDDNIADLLDKARKQNVGLILAHQRLANITSPNVLDALSNVAIKFAGGNVTDSGTLARYMRTTPEFVADQPALSFAAFIRGQTPSAIKISVEYGKMEGMERMTDDEYAQVERVMRERYSATVSADAPVPTQAPTNDNATDAEWEDVR